MALDDGRNKPYEHELDRTYEHELGGFDKGADGITEVATPNQHGTLWYHSKIRVHAAQKTHSQVVIEPGQITYEDSTILEIPVEEHSSLCQLLRESNNNQTLRDSTGQTHPYQITINPLPEGIEVIFNRD